LFGLSGNQSVVNLPTINYSLLKNLHKAFLIMAEPSLIATSNVDSS